MKFTKMHGIGNDYVYVNCMSEAVENPSETAKLVSDRHFGIGSDGLILINQSAVADFEMEMYNADGSRGEMCGNGIRCVAKYVFDKGLTDKKIITIETLAGVKTVSLTVEEGLVSFVRVDMGSPELDADKIPVLVKEGQVVNAKMQVQDTEYYVTCVSMGNPHCVVFLENDIKDLDIASIGPEFEQHAFFPKRINTEFVNVLDKDRLQMRVWERGSGETLACGTGACASVVAAILNGHTKDHVTVELLGGSLQIEWDRQQNRVYMTGPATTVFEGETDLIVRGS
ncbi:MAG: diaminopimelate epimerase [Lachnospiraceae bacterium]